MRVTVAPSTPRIAMHNAVRTYLLRVAIPVVAIVFALLLGALLP